MIVEKPDALKQWMADILEHMSDAQPTKLARYVLALVRKAGSPDRLRATMLEQLDVFLHEATALFADQLLAALASGSYVTRPGEGRVVTLPVAPPPRRQVHLPPEETGSPTDVEAVVRQIIGSGPLPGSGSPIRTASNGVTTSSREPSPTKATQTNGRPMTSVSDTGHVTDLRLKLAGGPRRRRCPDSDERGVCLRSDDCPQEHGPEKVVLLTRAPAPPTRPQSPPPAAPAEPCRPEAPGLTESPWRPSLPAGGARQLTTARTVSIEQDTGPLDTCSLHLRGVPPDLNQIMPLNEYLSTFGRIVNIQVSFGADLSAALVTFDQPEEAEAALCSPEPVLGCRQITVRPHRTERTVISGRQMALSGLKRTVANPDAARRISEQDSLAPAWYGNGDPSPSPSPVPAADEGPPDPSQQEDAADEQGAAAEGEAGGQLSEESAQARRQGIQEVRRAQELLAATIALEAKRKEKQQAARRLAADLQRREADLLQRQLEQQRHLLSRLDSPGLRPADRAALLEALKALQAASLSTRTGLAAALGRESRETSPRLTQSGGRRRGYPADDGRDAGQADQPAAKLPAGLSQETEREVLDLELALYQRQLAGAETEALQRRLSRLRQAAVPTRGRGRGVRGRGRGRIARVGPGRLSSIDRRPSTLIVSDFAAVGRTAVIDHLTTFGEVTDCRPAGDSGGALAVTFGSRRQAEAALATGATVGLHRLTLAWPDSQAASTAVGAAKAANGTAQSFQTDLESDQSAEDTAPEQHANLSDFEDEEGEDADDEDERSWRP